MQRPDYRIHIVGAGISGLIAARVLESKGFYPRLIDASDRAGGRLKTEEVDGFLLDHGFQVLLTAYPAVHEYLELDKLNLQYYKPGAAIYKNGPEGRLGDPLRDLSFLWPTLSFQHAGIKDKWLILKLQRELRSKSPEDLFLEKDSTTREFLIDYGFSEKVIQYFFRPFFSGIFLEPDLQTSSRMFRFVYKMFGEGNAAVPAAGIEAIPRQLESQLKHTSFQYNTRVSKVEEGKVVLESGEELPSHATIIATDAAPLVSQLAGSQTWKSCDNLYFEATEPVIKEPLIGLLAAPDALTNNVCYPTLLTDPEGDSHLLSVTVVKKHGLQEQELVAKVQGELEEHLGISEARFLKRFQISHALPRMTGPKYSMDPTETRLTESIFLAGDHLLNGSLNAAMISGERAAIALADHLS